MCHNIKKIFRQEIFAEKYCDPSTDNINEGCGWGTVKYFEQFPEAIHNKAKFVEIYQDFTVDYNKQ